MLTRGNWYLLDHFNELPLTAYFNLLSFEIMERQERQRRMEAFALKNKTKEGLHPQTYSVLLLEEILKCL